jgi:hypothetical protein
MKNIEKFRVLMYENASKLQSLKKGWKSIFIPVVSTEKFIPENSWVNDRPCFLPQNSFESRMLSLMLFRDFGVRSSVELIADGVIFYERV